MARPKTRSTRQTASSSQEVTVVRITASPKRRRGRPPKAVLARKPDVNPREEDVVEKEEEQEEFAQDASTSMLQEATARQASPDPYSFPVSPKQHATASGKRPASEIDAKNSPSAAKRRRLVSGANKGRSKAPAAVSASAAAQRVDPGVLHVLNQGARQLKGIQSPKVVVEIPRQRGLRQKSSAGAPPSAQPQGRRGVEEEDDEEEAGGAEEPEEEQQPEEEEQAVEDKVVDDNLLQPPTPKPTASRSAIPRKLTATGTRTTGVVNRPKATRAGPSNPVRRHPSTSARPGPSNSARPGPPPGNQLVLVEDDPDSEVDSEEGDEIVTVNQIQPLPAPAPELTTATFESFPDEEAEDDYDYDDADEDDEFSPKTVDIPMEEVSSIAAHMRLKAWTNLGKDWSQALLDQYGELSENDDIEGCRNELLHLRRGLSKAPHHPRLKRQTDYLLARRDLAAQSSQRILPYIDRLSQQLCQRDRPARKRVINEVCRQIIPLLVLLLRHFCLLGGAAQNERGELQLPSHGTFTWAALQLPGHVMKWLKKLAKPLDDTTQHELEAWDAGRRRNMPQDLVDRHLERQKTCAEILRAYDTFYESIEALQIEVDRPKILYKEKMAEAEFHRKRREEAKAAIERRKARFEAFARSTQELKNRRNPYEEAEAEAEKRADRERRIDLRRGQEWDQPWPQPQTQTHNQRQQPQPQQQQQPKQLQYPASSSRPAGTAAPAQPSSSRQQPPTERDEPPQPPAWTKAQDNVLLMYLSEGKALDSDDFKLIKDMTGHKKDDVEKRASILRRYARQET